jgi:uncharacterized protein (TIGR02246 family)
MTDKAAVSRWIDGYVRAWNTNDREHITALFTEDAVYFTEPYHAPWKGRDQIVAGWLEKKDEPGETSFEWQPVSITDEVAVISGTTRYPENVFSNLWVIRFDPDGRCREFSEWWMEHPAHAGG